MVLASHLRDWMETIGDYVNGAVFKLLSESYVARTNEEMDSPIEAVLTLRSQREKWLEQFENHAITHYQEGGKTEQGDMVLSDNVEWDLLVPSESPSGRPSVLDSSNHDRTIRLLYLGREMWLVDKFTIERSSVASEKPIPILIASNPAWLAEHGVSAWTRGDLLEIATTVVASFAMIGSVGDYLNRSGETNDCSLKEWEHSTPVYDEHFPAELILSGLFVQNSVLKDCELIEGTELFDALSEQFIPTFKDKRGMKMIDKCKGQYPLYHDEIRCAICNGRVLLKLPAGNKVIKAKCPHSLESFKKKNQHDIHFPHLSPNLEVVGDVGLDSPTEMK